MEQSMVIIEKNSLALRFFLLVSLFVCTQQSYSQNELLWIKKMKKGKEITVSNFLSYKTKVEYIFPLIRVKVDKEYNYISYKRHNIFDYKLFFKEYKPIIAELYGKKILIITHKQMHETFPFNIVRDSCIIIDFNEPRFYYVAKFDGSIYITHKNMDNVPDDFSPSFFVENISFKEGQLTLVSNDLQEKREILMSKFENPSYDMRK